MSDAAGTYFLPGFGYVPYSGFWGPIGDIFPLAPVWSEHHVPQGLTATSTTESSLRQDLRIPFGIDYTFEVDLTDEGADLTTIADDLPAGDITLPYKFSRVTSAIVAPFGWAETWPMTIVAPGAPDAWDGTLSVTIDAALQDKIGFDRSCPYRVQLYVKDRITDEESRVDVMVGVIVVRP